MSRGYFLGAVHGILTVAASVVSRGYSLGAVHGILTVAASLVAEHSSRAHRLSSFGEPV